MHNNKNENVAAKDLDRKYRYLSIGIKIITGKNNDLKDKN